MPPRRWWRRGWRGQRGSAIADFALVSVVLVPLFFGVLQLALIWHVRATLTSAATDGARYAAAYTHSLPAGAARTRAVIDDVLGTDLPDRVHARMVSVRGQPAVEVQVSAEVPVIAFWGPTVTVETRGHAVRETLP